MLTQYAPLYDDSGTTLDAPLYDDSGTTLGDAITRGLWD
jgi:hypothetical protein